MRKTILSLAVMIIFIAANFVTADTRELDPAVPLDNYISVGEWNTPGDRDGWDTDNQLDGLAVVGGSITGTISGAGNDPWIEKELSVAAGAYINIPAGTIFEIRIKYGVDANLSTASAYAYFLDSAVAWNPIPYATVGEIQTDGQFHVYRLTVSSAIGNGIMRRSRIDMTQGVSFPGLGIEIDYIRIKTPAMVDPTYRAGQSFASANSLAEWNTPGDFENWTLVNILDGEVAGGYLTATNNGDGQITKDNAAGLPQIDLDSADNKIVEVRLRRETSDTTDLQVFYGTSVTPGVSAARRIVFGNATVPTDGNFHLYYFDMGTESAWTGTLQTIRTDPSSAVSSQIDVDYIRVGQIIPEPATLGLLVILGLAFLRKK